MRITHVSYADLQGGAARAVYRLHQGLLRAGEDSKLFVECRESEEPSVVGFQYPRDLPTRLRRRLRHAWLTRTADRLRESLAPGASYFSDCRSANRADALAQLPEYDILNLHWISGFIDYAKFFRRVPKDRPIVWTLHDMHAFTGGCHFDAGCGRFYDSCGACPQLKSANPRDFTHQSWARRRSAYQSLRPSDPKRGALHIVTPSQWLGAEARRSSLFRDFDVSVIPNGLDTEIFQPRDPSAARSVLGLPQDRKMLLFLADWAREERKGLHLLVEALRGIPDPSGFCLLILGRGRITLPDSLPVARLDYLRNDRMLSQVYSAADLFLLPALQDNLPNTVLESMACGVPIVAFNIGGVPDMVRDGVEGRLVPAGDVAALRTAITATLQDEPLRQSMAAAARSRVLSDFPLSLQAQRYQSLYRHLSSSSLCASAV